MHPLPPECPECSARDARLLSVKDAYLNDPPQPKEKPLATVAVFLCECGHVFTLVTHSRPATVPQQ